MKHLFGIFIGSIALCGFSETLKESLEGQFIVTVPEGETYTLTEEDVLALGTNNLVKTGGGELFSGAVMSNYVGDIFITNGLFHVKETGALGPLGGKTYVSGSGTLVNHLDAPNTWTSEGGYPSFGVKEHLFLEGTGYNQLGALRNHGYCQNLVHNLTFTGDTLITQTEPIDLRFCNMDMGYHTLTISNNSEQTAFRLVASSNISRWGDIHAIKGSLNFQDSLPTGAASNLVTLCDGGTFTIWLLKQRMKPTILFKGAGYLQCTYMAPTIGESTAINTWEGEVQTTGMLNNIMNAGAGFSFAGPVTGTGGFTGGKGGWLQFESPSNTFSGGVSLVGKDYGVSDLAVTGGVSSLKNGSIPVDGAPLQIKNAHFLSFASPVAHYPDLITDGKAIVSSITFNAACTYKTLTKKGNGTLSFFGPAQILGTTELQGGTVRFATRIPQAMGGLHYWHDNLNCGITRQIGTATYYGVNPAGATYAYTTWPYFFDGSGNGGYKNNLFYTGYLCVPGETGTSVTCNFLSSIARHTRIEVDGQTVIRMNDNHDDLSGVTHNDWKRLCIGPKITLTAGWHPISIYMGNSWDATGGPLPYPELGWVPNFGIGIDWQGRGETNAAHYVKLLDPGDGSFLRATLDSKNEFDPFPYRPAFLGAVKSTPGTILDLNDTQPYTSFQIPSLTGALTLTNGAAAVTNTLWTLRYADVTSGKPLTITSGSTLTFAPNTTFRVEEVDALPRSPSRYPLIRVDAGGTLENPPTFDDWTNSKWYAEWSADGTELDLVLNDALLLMIR